MKKKICIIITIVLVAILASAVFFVYRNQFSLTINGTKIDKEEFLDAMAQKKYEVISSISGKTAAGMDADFWEREVDGTLPYEMLADEALEQLKYIHAVYSLAVEKGYVSDESYESMVKRWQEENQLRKEKIANGEVVYGLSEYTLELYREYEMDTIQKRYCEEEENEGMDISDEEREAYYKEHEASYQQEDDLMLDYIMIPYENEGMSEEEVEEFKSRMTELYKKTDKEHSLAELVAADKKLSPYLAHADVTEENLREYARTISDIVDYGYELKAGESTGVLDEYGCLYLIECTERTANEATPVEEVKDHINKTLREEHYDEIVAKRAADMSVECDKERIYFFTKKNINN